MKKKNTPNLVRKSKSWITWIKPKSRHVSSSIFILLHRLNQGPEYMGAERSMSYKNCTLRGWSAVFFLYMDIGYIYVSFFLIQQTATWKMALKINQKCPLKKIIYIVMHSDGNNFCRDVVLDSIVHTVQFTVYTVQHTKLQRIKIIRIIICSYLL